MKPTPSDESTKKVEFISTGYIPNIIEKMYRDQLHTDGILCIISEVDKTNPDIRNGKTRIGIHKSILSMQSDYFKTLFKGSFREKDARTYEIIEDSVSGDIFSKFIYLFYVDCDVLSDETKDKLLSYVLELTYLSTKYGFSRLMNICRERMMNTVCKDTVKSYLEYARNNNEPELSNMCMQWMKSFAFRYNIISDDDTIDALGVEHTIALLFSVDIPQYANSKEVLRRILIKSNAWKEFPERQTLEEKFNISDLLVPLPDSCLQSLDICSSALDYTFTFYTKMSTGLHANAESKYTLISTIIYKNRIRLNVFMGTDVKKETLCFLVKWVDNPDSKEYIDSGMYIGIIFGVSVITSKDTVKESSGPHAVPLEFNGHKEFDTNINMHIYKDGLQHVMGAEKIATIITKVTVDSSSLLSQPQSKRKTGSTDFNQTTKDKGKKKKQKTN